MKEDTIVSISTPLGKGAVAIVRMSGKYSLKFAKKLFHCKKLESEEICPRYLYLGKFEIEKGVFEECLMAYFQAPYSYTGEDIVEFQVHGGVLLAEKIMRACVNVGARLAEAGEFSKRAFLNGKITLDKAEAIIGEINAESEGELRTSLKITNGVLAEKVEKTQQELTTLLAEIEVGMDYPDETEETQLKTDIAAKLSEIKEELNKILTVSISARYLKDGINVALVGKTNVGKSSVMNALLGENRSIVTDIQGTTRDSIKESFVYGGIKINLIDTAGIRKTKDVVENMGIERSKSSLNSADVVLFVLDGSEKESTEDKEIEALLQGKNFVYVINKADKQRKLAKKDGEIEISALENKNIDKLKEKIVKLVIEEEIDFNALIVTNERQFEILKDAEEQIEAILKEKTKSLDVLSMLIKKVWNTLGKITGNTENENIIDLIFSKFCLGK